MMMLLGQSMVHAGLCLRLACGMKSQMLGDALSCKRALAHDLWRVLMPSELSLAQQMQPTHVQNLRHSLKTSWSAFVRTAFPQLSAHCLCLQCRMGNAARTVAGLQDLRSAKPSAHGNEISFLRGLRSAWQQPDDPAQPETTADFGSLGESATRDCAWT